MTIYTRRGDAGLTSLVGGERVSKAGARVEAYGTVDEANSAVGLARSVAPDEFSDSVLHFVQQKLFNCSSSLATPFAERTERTPAIRPEDIVALERSVDRFEERTGPLEHFVIEAGCEAASRLQLARAVLRRAERRAVALADSEQVDEQVLAFLNRCSDVLFAAARYANALSGVVDEPWDPEAAPPR